MFDLDRPLVTLGGGCRPNEFIAPGQKIPAGCPSVPASPRPVPVQCTPQPVGRD